MRIVATMPDDKKLVELTEAEIAFIRDRNDILAEIADLQEIVAMIPETPDDYLLLDAYQDRKPKKPKAKAKKKAKSKPKAKAKKKTPPKETTESIKPPTLEPGVLERFAHIKEDFEKADPKPSAPAVALDVMNEYKDVVDAQMLSEILRYIGIKKSRKLCGIMLAQDKKRFVRLDKGLYKAA